jgi:DHA2 family multidrug resistance protein
MGMLFIPITALSLSTLKGKQIGQGAAFTGMMRQLGGSFGIALITTFMTRRTIEHSQHLAENVTATNPLATQRIAGTMQKFMSAGMPQNMAEASSYKAIQGAIYKQATVLSYMDVFFWLGFIFVALIPIILMVRSKKEAGKVDLSEAMH